MDLKRHKIKILGVDVDDIDLDGAVDRAIFLSQKQNKGKYIVTVNPEFVMLAYRNKKFAKILANSDLAVADGVGVAVSKLIMGGRVSDRITGVDFLEKLTKIGAEKAVRIGFMGGFDDVAARVAKRQQKKYPGLEVVYAKPGEPTISYIPRLKRDFADIGRVDILFVAYGMGKQEFFIDEIRKYLNVGLYIGVGGAFDFLAGEKLRAPIFLQKVGLEWLWRLLLEPTRIWRMRVLPIFAFFVFCDFFRKKIFSKNL